MIASAKKVIDNPINEIPLLFLTPSYFSTNAAEAANKIEDIKCNMQQTLYSFFMFLHLSKP